MRQDRSGDASGSCPAPYEASGGDPNDATLHTSLFCATVSRQWLWEWIWPRSKRCWPALWLMTISQVDSAHGTVECFRSSLSLVS